jgi:hypothetical protein
MSCCLRLRKCWSTGDENEQMRMNACWWLASERADEDEGAIWFFKSRGTHLTHSHTGLKPNNGLCDACKILYFDIFYTKYILSFVQNKCTICKKSYWLLGHSCQGHLCLFSLHLTPLDPLHGTGASGSFGFEKQGQTCKVKKIEANVQLELKTRAVMQLVLKFFSPFFYFNQQTCSCIATGTQCILESNYVSSIDASCSNNLYEHGVWVSHIQDIESVTQYVFQWDFVCIIARREFFQLVWARLLSTGHTSLDHIQNTEGVSDMEETFHNLVVRGRWCHLF